MTADLFQQRKFNDLLGEWPVIEKRTRTVTDYYTAIEGVRFDARDLLDTLEHVAQGDVTTDFTARQTEVLLAHGILRTAGCRRWGTPAELGPNGQQFVEMLREEIGDDR